MSQPICVSCGLSYNPKRAALGYDTCLFCSDEQPIKPIQLEVSKSNATITMDPSQLLGPAFKDRKVESDRKIKAYVSLRSFKDEKLYKK